MESELTLFRQDENHKCAEVDKFTEQIRQLDMNIAATKVRLSF